MVLRQLVDRLLAGESSRSLASWLNTTGVPTVKGAEHWQTPTLRQMPCSARFAGLRECRGQIVGDAVWEPIHYRRETKTDLAHFAAHTRSGRRALGTHLLSGMLWCGKCGNTLYSSSREATNHNSRRRYVACPAPIMVAAAG